MMKKIWKISTLKYLAAFLIPLIFVILLNHGLDNDSWGVLAEGREIVKNGIYYTDALSMHEGLSVTVQNYGFAVLYYYVFSIFGASGIYAVMLLLNFAVCFLIYKICMLISDKNTNLSLCIMMITDILLALGFVVTRAQMVSYVIFLLFIYVLELYIKTNKTKYLWWAPLLSILQINLHASLWWMLILVLIVYIIDSVKKPKLHLQGYRTLPLIVAGFVMVLFGLINPYGINMITFIFKSYGDVRFQNMVYELKAFSPFGGVLNIFVYMSIVVVMFLFIFGKGKDVRIRYFLMFFGFLALGMNTIKGLSQFILVMFFPLALFYKNIRMERILDTELGRSILIFWTGIVAICFFISLSIVAIPHVENEPKDGVVSALDAIDIDVVENNKMIEDVKIYTGYNDGGYVEYRGYKPYLDPRGEVFLKKNNKKEDILYEWIDLSEGRKKVVEFLEKYDFDYILVTKKDDPLYDLDDDKNYDLLFSEEEKMVKVYKRKNLVSILFNDYGL